MRFFGSPLSDCQNLHFHANLEKSIKIWSKSFKNRKIGSNSFKTVFAVAQGGSGVAREWLGDGSGMARGGSGWLGGGSGVARGGRAWIGSILFGFHRKIA